MRSVRTVTPNKVIVDTDILSMFAKADAIEALVEAFGSWEPHMTPAIRDEIMVPFQYGFNFPKKVLDTIPTVVLTQEMMEDYLALSVAERSVGRGELEAIVYCRNTGALFATNDAHARAFAQAQGINVISLQAILRILWEERGWPKRQVSVLLERIRKADRLTLSPEVEAEIFEE